jgi:site-specific DNA recombinase
MTTMTTGRRYLPASEAEFRGLRARGYLRESTEEQGQNSGPEAGRRTIAAVADQYGLVLGPEYLDLASGADPDARPAFQQMLRDAEAGLFDLLLVPYRTRFGRNWRLDGALVSRLHEAGVAVYFCDERTLTSRPEDDIAEAVHGALGTKFLVDLSRNVHRGYRVKRFEQGRWSGTVPIGYRMAFEERWNATKGGHDLVETGQIVPDERPVPLVGFEGSYTRADLVRLVGERYASGLFGLHGLADALNAEGFRTAKGEPFTRSSVRVIISNRAYLGEMSWLRRSKKVGRSKAERKARPVFGDAQIVEGHHEPLWTPDLWAAIREVAERQSTGGGGAAKRGAPVSPYSRKVRCGSCGSTMYVERKTRGVAYLACPRQREGARPRDSRVHLGPCGQRAFREDRLDALVGGFLDEIEPPSPAEMRRAVEALDRREAPAPTADEAGIEDALRRVSEAFDGMITREEANAPRAALDAARRAALDAARRAALDAQRRAAQPRGTMTATAVAEQARLLADIRRLWAAATPRERAEIVETLFEGFRVENGEPVGFLRPDFEVPVAASVACMARPEGVGRAVLAIGRIGPLVDAMRAAA